MRIKRIVTYKTFILLVTVIGCINPFAPSFDDSSDHFGEPLGDQTTIDGLFQNFRASYNTQDTLIYGKLLHPEFVFTYTDYDNGIDESWARAEDMRVTHRLFMNTINIDLIWNEIIMQAGDSLKVNVSRSFNLYIAFSADDLVHISGYANLVLKREESDDVWQITFWRDESNF